MINLSSLKLGEEAIEVFYAGRYKHSVPAKWLSCMEAGLLLEATQYGKARDLSLADPQ